MVEYWKPVCSMVFMFCERKYSHCRVAK